MDPAALEDMNVEVAARLQMLKEQTQDQLLLALANQKSFGFKIDIKVFAMTPWVNVVCLSYNCC